MKNKKEIISFLNELIIGLQEKRDKQLEHIQQVKESKQHDNCGYLHILQVSKEHTIGQLYEINYILTEITRDKRKKL